MPLLVLTLVGEATKERTLGWVAIAAAVPMLVFALPGGISADRYDRRRIVIAAEIISASLLTIVAILIMTDSMSIALVIILSAVLSTMSTLFASAVEPMVPLIVDAVDLEEANGKLSAVTDGTEFLGLPLGSLLFSFVPWLPFLFDAASFAGSAAMLRGLPPSITPPAPDGEPVRLAPALKWVRASRPLMVLWVMLGLLAMSGSIAITLTPIVLGDRVGVDERWYGWMLVLITLGATLAGLLCKRVSARLGSRNTLLAAVLVNAVAYVLFGTTTRWYLAGVALLLWGFSVTTGVIVSKTMRQRLIPSHLLGRVMSMYQLVVASGLLIGAALVSIVGSGIDSGSFVVVAGFVQIAVLVLLVVGLRQQDLPAERASSTA